MEEILEKSIGAQCSFWYHRYNSSSQNRPETTNDSRNFIRFLKTKFPYVRYCVLLTVSPEGFEGKTLKPRKACIFEHTNKMMSWRKDKPLRAQMWMGREPQEKGCVMLIG